LASTGGKAKAGSTDWQELDAHVMGHKVAVRVSPVIRKDEATSIMALELTRAKDDASVDRVKTNSSGSEGNKLSISNYLGSPSIYRPGTGASLVKLLNLGSGRVWSTTDGSGANDNGFLEVTPGEQTTSYLSFGKVDTDTVTVMVPMAGFTTVSVLEADAAKKAGVDLNAASSELDQFPGAATELAAPVAIERYTRALDDSTSTHTGGQDITVTLASDVTFASDSADLTPAADTQLQTVADQLNQYPDGGTLSIVGHTDDIQDDAYNQPLSEKRANAVKDRLQQLTTLDKWSPTTTGKGESEPRVKETTDEARAANRRVEITLTPTGGTGSSTKRGGLGNGTGSATPSARTSSGGSSLPEAKGPVGKGAEGVTVQRSDGSGRLTISLDHVTRADGYLLGEVKVVAVDGDASASDWFHDIDSGGIFSNSRNEDSASVQYTLSRACDGLAVVAGDMQVLPADYVPGGKDTHWPLADFNLAEKLQAGTAMTVAVVWPDPGGDTITVDHQSIKKGEGSYAYRLTDIPVKDN